MFQFFLRKKNWPILFSTLFSLSVWAEKVELCSIPQYQGNNASYSFLSKKSVCENQRNCWLQFQSPEDAIQIEVNDKNILELSETRSYHANESFLLPLNASNIQTIVIKASDTNQDKRFAQELCIRLGKYDELRWINSTQWFFRTGVNLFSAYFLVIISLFLGFSFWLRRSGIGLSLFIYSVVSAIYLFSFSEYPRSLTDPVLASGGIHFPLRLLQDLCLIFVFYNFHQKNDSHNIIRKLSWVYSIIIGIYVLMLAIGIKDYIYYARIIIIMAPLVAAPMAIGTWFAFKLKDPIERKVLIPISIILFIFQLNDLLIFWKLSNSYFTIRIYIPFIVGMSLFLYFRRMHQESSGLGILNERQRLMKEFLHDIKSPLAVLRVFQASRIGPEEHGQIISSALDRIEKMVSQVAQPQKDEAQTKFKVISTLGEIIEQKKLEYKDFKISIDPANDTYIFANKSKLERIFSNLINNAYEAYTDDKSKSLEIKVIFGADDVRIFFEDKGKGIPKTMLDRLSQEEVTNKTNGQGIGLSSAYRYISEIGGNLQVISKEGMGTTVEVILLTASGDIISVEQEKSFDSELGQLDFILIDDDKYIRAAWKTHAQDTAKKVKAYESIEAFFADADRISKETPIYLDVNLKEGRSIDQLGKFEEMGFKNITLATGEEIAPANLPTNIRGVSGKLPPLQ